MYWQTSLLVPSVRAELKALRAAGGAGVSQMSAVNSAVAGHAVIVRDPDGRALRVMESGNSLAEK